VGGKFSSLNARFQSLELSKDWKRVLYMATTLQALVFTRNAGVLHIECGGKFQ
jgi:hypothetical protein